MKYLRENNFERYVYTIRELKMNDIGPKLPVPSYKQGKNMDELTLRFRNANLYPPNPFYQDGKPERKWRVCYKQRKPPSSPPPWRTCSASCSTGSADTSSTHCTEYTRRHTPERCRSANSQSPPSESDSLCMIAAAHYLLPEAMCFMPSNMKYSTIKQVIRNYRPSRAGVSP